MAQRDPCPRPLQASLQGKVETEERKERDGLVVRATGSSLSGVRDIAVFGFLRKEFG